MTDAFLSPCVLTWGSIWTLDSLPVLVFFLFCVTFTYLVAGWNNPMSFQVHHFIIWTIKLPCFFHLIYRCMCRMCWSAGVAWHKMLSCFCHKFILREPSLTWTSGGGLFLSNLELIQQVYEYSIFLLLIFLRFILIVLVISVSLLVRALVLPSVYFRKTSC